MLRPIPQRVLRDLVTIKVCAGVDAWQNPIWTEYQVSNVHLQNTNEVKKTKDNTEVVLRSELYIDGKRSTPQLDYDALMTQSEAAGRPMRAVVYNYAGTQIGDYEVAIVDTGPNVPDLNPHHVTLGLR